MKKRYQFIGINNASSDDNSFKDIVSKIKLNTIFSYKRINEILSEIDSLKVGDVFKAYCYNGDPLVIYRLDNF